MQPVNIPETVARLRESGNDTFNVEVKAAASAMPKDIDETLSAFANMPEGGLILLGLSEGRWRIQINRRIRRESGAIGPGRESPRANRSGGSAWRSRNREVRRPSGDVLRSASPGSGTQAVQGGCARACLHSIRGW